MAMTNRGSKVQKMDIEGNVKETNFERNKYRQTMPSNSRFNPLSPPDNRYHSADRVNSRSPTQSHVSTATTYEKPWSSPKFDSTAQTPDPKFRRTHSVAVRKLGKSGGGNESKKNDRPKINFKEFGKKITSTFRRNDKKNGKNVQNEKSRMNCSRLSVPIISLDETSTSHSLLLSTSSPSPTKKNGVKGTSSMKMQPEDRLKMFQKMGREQAMKVSNVQRMQRERQRDFSLVPGPGRSCLEANVPPAKSSNQSVVSMVVFNSTPTSYRRSESLSMTEDDVEPIFKNSFTNEMVTSSQFKNQQKMSTGPIFTSTPRLKGNLNLREESPTTSNLKSISESSFCIMNTSDDVNVNRMPNNATTYYSSDTFDVARVSENSIIQRNVAVAGIPSRSMTDVTMTSTSPTPTPSTAVHKIPVKQEVVEQENRSSNCPSISSTRSSEPTAHTFTNVPENGDNGQPEHLNNLWMVSKEIREKQLQLEHSLPVLESMQNKSMELEQQRISLLDSKGDKPSIDDMRCMWKLQLELYNLRSEMETVSVVVYNANRILPYLEMRRNELLSISPPPPTSLPSSGLKLSGSFV